MAGASLRGSIGLPVCVQVAALPFRDEMALRVMSDLESAVDPSLLRPSHRAVNGETKVEEYFAAVASRVCKS